MTTTGTKKLDVGLDNDTPAPVSLEGLEAKLNQILDQQETILEQQDELIELLLERGVSGMGYTVERSFDFDES